MEKIFFALAILLQRQRAASFRSRAALPPNKHPQSSQPAEMVEAIPKYLYKVLSTDDWGKSCKTIHLSGMDADFIHLSTEEQLNKIVEKYWVSVSEHVVLKLERRNHREIWS